MRKRVAVLGAIMNKRTLEGLRVAILATHGFRKRVRPRNSTGHVEDGVGVRTSRLQDFNGLGGWQDLQFNLKTTGLLLYLVHHRQSTRPCANHQTAAWAGRLSSAPTIEYA